MELALTHSSARKVHNERLEFLGDAALGALVAEFLFLNYPDATEGELTQRRSQFVNNQQSLCGIGESIALDEFIKVDKGFPWTNKRARRNLLANAVEALIGAIYLDGGLDAARNFIFSRFPLQLDSIDKKLQKNPKSLLQEYLQKLAQPIPHYELIETKGSDHTPIFVVSCQISSLDSSATAEGGSIKEAEQNAAAKIYELLKR